MPQVSNSNRYSGTFNSTNSTRRTSSVQSGTRRVESSNTKNVYQRDSSHKVRVRKPLPDVPIEKKWTLVPGFCCISSGTKEINVHQLRNKKTEAVVQDTEMPNIKGRVNDFFHRQLSLVTPTPAVEPSTSPHVPVQPRVKPRRSHSLREESVNKPETKAREKVRKNETSSASRTEKASSGSFISRYLNGSLKKNHPDIICGKTCYDLPVKEIDKLSKSIVAAYTGPGLGLTAIDNSKKLKAFKPPVDDVDFIDEDIDFDDGDFYLENGKKSQSSTTRKSSSTYPTSFSPSFKSNFELIKSKEIDNGQSVSQDRVAKSPNSQTSSASPSSSGCNDHISTSPSITEPIDKLIAGIDDWQRPSSSFAYGISTSLYESHPTLKEQAGEPVADSFGICVRENSAILALADGVNWGEKASLASRCAINGCLDYLNKSLYHESSKVENTMDIFVCLLRSFSAAHDLILQEKGMLTTLTVAVVAQLKHSEKFIVCTCNVGDSLAYIYSKAHGVREVTQGSHDIFSMRDMRDALGALGPVDGQNPELNNLTVAMTIVEKGDIVFLTSDGVSDNFDPVVGKFAIPQKKESPPVSQQVSKADEPDSGKLKNGETKSRSYQVRLKRSNSNPDRDSAHRPSPNPGLPTVSAEQRHELTLLRMEDIVKNGLKEGDQTPDVTARTLCESMIDFASKLTTAKRRTLEDPDLYEDGEEFGQREQRRRRRRVGEKLLVLPGKLDHASVVAYKVGFRGRMVGTKYSSKSKEYEKRHDLKLKASLVKFSGSQDDFACISAPQSP